MGLFDKFRDGLKKTQDKLVHEIKRIVTFSPKLTENSIEELEMALIAADFGMEMTTRIVDAVRKEFESQGRAGMDVFAVARFLRDAVAVRQIPGIFGGGGVIGMPDHAAAFEHQRLQAFFREFLGGPAAAHSGSHDDGIERIRFHALLQPPSRTALWTTHAFFWFRSIRPIF